MVRGSPTSPDTPPGRLGPGVTEEEGAVVRVKPPKRMFFYCQYLRHLDDLPDHLLSLGLHLKGLRKVRKVCRLP